MKLIGKEDTCSYVANNSEVFPYGGLENKNESMTHEESITDDHNSGYLGMAVQLHV